MELFTIRDLRGRTGELVTNAKHGHPPFVAVPRDDELLSLRPGEKAPARRDPVGEVQSEIPALPSTNSKAPGGLPGSAIGRSPAAVPSAEAAWRRPRLGVRGYTRSLEMEE